jgi:hypothetical protein
MGQETAMFEIVAVSSEPLLYIATRTSDRASAIAATIKTSHDQVLRFMDERGIGPVGKPVAVFSDWTGRLVTIEAGYPVSQDDLALAAGRVQAGYTPKGPAVRRTRSSATVDHARWHEAFADEARTSGLRLTGTTWETYDRGPTGGGVITEFYAQLLDAHDPRTPFGG